MAEGFIPDLEALFAEQQRRNTAVIERACEVALQEGTCGVTVFPDQEGNVLAIVDARVPFGQVDYRPRPGPDQ